MVQHLLTIQQEERKVYNNQPLAMLWFPHGQQIHSVATCGHVAAYITPGAQWKDTDPSPISSEIQKAGACPRVTDMHVPQQNKGVCTKPRMRIDIPSQGSKSSISCGRVFIFQQGMSQSQSHSYAAMLEAEGRKAAHVCLSQHIHTLKIQ